MPGLDSFEENISWRSRLRMLLPLLRFLALGALIFALARPQKVLKDENINAEAVSYTHLTLPTICSV